jgi:phosphoribosylamine---glycine ligase
VRFGDPECQVLMMRLRSDLLAAFLATADGVLDKFSLRWSDEAALTVVMVTKGYPGPYAKGSEIRGLDSAGAKQGVVVFHAGTKCDGGRIIADGGRVLNVTATGRTVAEAKAKAYAAAAKIDWPEGFYRRDIGWRAV